MKRSILALGVLLLLLLGWRAFDAWRSPSLPPWLTEVPDEPDAGELDDLNWEDWLAAEAAMFSEVQERVVAGQQDSGREAPRRFSYGASADERRLLEWNRSQLQLPEGEPRGVAVLLHGLTDSPYSLRHLAAFYRERGFAVLAIRLPGHGTVPAALTKVRWEDWLAATRLAVRHARTLAPSESPLHLVGYSNGAALAVKYTLDSLGDQRLPRATQLVLISPMIGVTRLARFAGVLGWPAAFPPFAKAAWLDIEPEYNPFKYNSFAVNAARQSSQLTRAVRKQLESLHERAALGDLPPVLTFQSVLDHTVDVRALINALYARLPANGSELVLFGCNEGEFTRPEVCQVLDGLLPGDGGNFRYSLVRSGVEEQVAVNGARIQRPIELRFPDDVYSLSHVALPFPGHDEFYGLPGLGGIAPRGERDALVVSAATLMRMSWNPFFPLMRERIGTTIPESTTSSPP